MSTKKRSDDDGDYFLRWLGNDLTPEERSKMRNRNDYEEMESMKNGGLSAEREQPVFKRSSSPLVWIVLVGLVLVGMTCFYYCYYA